MYGSKYDGIIAAAVRLQKDAAACLKSDGLKEAMLEIGHQYLMEYETGVYDAPRAVHSVPASTPSPEQRMVNFYVKLLAHDDADNTWQLALQLAQTQAGRARGDAIKGEYVIIVYDVKVSGAASPPPCRQPAWRRDHYDRLTKAVICSRGESLGELHPGDLYLGFDGGKPCMNIGDVFTGHGLKCMKRRSQVLHTDVNSIVLHEESLQMVTADPLVRAGGMGDAPLEVPEHNRGAVWKLRPNERNAVFGLASRGTPDNGTAVAVFSHSMPVHVAEVLICRHNAQAVVDLTPGDGAWAMACMRTRTPYTGIAFTNAHRVGLAAWLESQVQVCMHDDLDPLYEPGSAATEAELDQPPAKRQKMEDDSSLGDDDDAETLQR